MYFRSWFGGNYRKPPTVEIGGIAANPAVAGRDQRGFSGRSGVEQAGSIPSRAACPGSQPVGSAPVVEVLIGPTLSTSHPHTSPLLLCWILTFSS